MRVFVYGTLKRHERNHTLVAAQDPTKISGATIFGMRLYHVPRLKALRPYAYPALYPGKGHALGELVEFKNENALRTLDELETEGIEYQRRKCWVRVRGKPVQAWVYVYASKAWLAKNKARALRGVRWRDQGV